MRNPRRLAALLCCLRLSLMGAELEREALDFPTSNRALLENRPEVFFMGVDREGRRVWQGGSFGFTRMPLLHEGREIFTRFHEGADIAPVHFDASGKPRDEVRAMAHGTVVRVEERGGMGYGNQVVLRHDWSCGPVFTRYAHLESVRVAKGRTVRRGEVLGILGASGFRFDEARAHLHVEAGLMLQSGLEEERRFHDLNMAVLDPAALLRASRTSALDLPAHVASLPVAFVLETPAAAEPEFLRRHPWLASPAPARPRQGWRIHFTAWGFPVRFESLEEKPAARRVQMRAEWPGLHTWHTRQLLTGQGPAAELGQRGELLLELLLPGQAAGAESLR